MVPRGPYRCSGPGACAPAALCGLFNEPYEQTARRFWAVGDDPHLPDIKSLNKILKSTVGVKQLHRYYLKDKQPRFIDWRQDRDGVYVVVVNSKCHNGEAHCGIVEDGVFYDNHSAVGLQYWDETTKVQYAWRIR